MITTLKNPYVGPRTFLKEESHLYFGRDREARDLTALVASERLVLFYAQSGAGKSSLLNTRLIPDLEKSNYEVFPVGRVSSGDLSVGGATDNIYLYSLMRSLVQHEIAPGLLADLTLSQFLVGLNIDGDGYFYDGQTPNDLLEGETPWRRALIIDQFEEVFSTHLDAWEKREAFFRQLAQAMQADPYLWVVLVMREDYIAALDPYAHLLPGGLRTRYYMQRLSREAALKAMKSPVEKLRPYAEGVAEKLVENLASIQVQKPGGKLETQPGQYVEPVQLQVVCFGLWENLASEGTQITEQDLQEVGDVNQSLERYFDGRVSTVARQKNVPERLIREWFGKELITSGGIRNLVLRNQQQTAGLADEVIQTLQGDLVRAEMRAGQLWYELSHDRLIEPILTSNTKWFEQNLSLFQRQVVLWLQQARSDSLLLRGKELQAAEVEAEALKLTSDEQTFLEACRAWRKREQRDQLQRRIIQAALVVLVIFLAVAVYSSIKAVEASNRAEVEKVNAYLARDEANTQKSAAIQAQNEALTAKTEAERAKLEAEAQAEKALAGSLAAQADSLKGSNHALALLLGLEAYQRQDSLLTRTTLFHLLQFSPYTRLFGSAGPVSSLAVSPDGRVIASTSCREFSNTLCKNGEILLSDAVSHQQLAKIPGDYGFVSSLAIRLAGGKLLLAAGGCVPEDDQNRGCRDSQGQITLWEITDPTHPARLADLRSGHTGLVKTVAFNPAGTLLVSGSFDTQILLWDLSDPTQPSALGAPLQGHSSFVNSLAFSPDGKTLASGGDDQNLILWNVSQPAKVTRLGEPLRAHTAPINSLAFSPDGKHLASAGNDNLVILWKWDPAAGTLSAPLELKGHSGYVRSVTFNADGTLLASAAFDQQVLLWETTDGEQLGLPLSAHTKAINALAFGLTQTAEGVDLPYLLSGGDDRVVIQWNLATRQPLSQPLSEPAAPPELGPIATSGQLTASVVNGQQIQLSGQPGLLSAHTGSINTLSFSPLLEGQQLLASASDDQTVILWDVKNATPYLKLESFASPVSAAYFEAGDLITLEKEGRTVEWTINPADWTTRACQAVNRNLTQAEWATYLPGQPFRKTCTANP